MLKANDCDCIVSGCDRRAFRRKMCTGHYTRWLKHDDVKEGVPIKDMSKRTAACLVVTCADPQKSLGLCERHFRMWHNRRSVKDFEYSTLNKGVCSVIGCEEKASTGGRCAAHHYRLKKHGDVRAHIPVRGRGGRSLCTVKGCGRLTSEKGYCAAHAFRLKKYGDAFPGWPIKEYKKHKRPVGCAVPGCTRVHQARGYCSTHYSKKLRDGEFCETSVGIEKCVVESCGRPMLAKGLCMAHYGRRHKLGNINESVDIARRVPGGDPAIGKRWRQGHYLRTSLRNAVLEKQENTCGYCGADGHLEIDHKVRIADGGDKLDIDNLQALCDSCHEQKTAFENSLLGKALNKEIIAFVFPQGIETEYVL